MIGTNLDNNDVWIFMTPEEITLLEKEEIKGDYVNWREDLLGTLTLKLNYDLQEMRDVGEITLDKVNEKTRNLEVVIYNRKYEDLVKRRSIGLHIGYAHIDIHDTEKLDGYQERQYYNELCLLKEKIEKNSD